MVRSRCGTLFCPTLAIALWAVLIIATGVGMAVWLLLAYGTGDDPRVQLDAIRTAGTLVVGAGGVVVLLLAARRQRTAEIALKQKDRGQADAARTHALQKRVAATTEADATARRITELFVRHRSSTIATRPCWTCGWCAASFGESRHDVWSVSMKHSQRE